MRADEFLHTQLGPRSSHPHWASRRRRWLQVAAVAPVAIVILLAILHPGSAWRWSKWLLVIIAACVAAGGAALISLTLCARMAESEHLIAMRERGLEQLHVRPGVLALLVAVGALAPALLSMAFDSVAVKLLCLLLAIAPLAAVWTGMRFLELTGGAAGTPGKQARSSERSARSRRGRQAHSGTPAWIRDLAEKSGLESCPDSPVRVEQAESAAASGSRDLAHLFGGFVPTADQARVLERFSTSHADRQGEAGEGSGAGATTPSIDLLVQGEAGSGKTTCLLACTTYATFVRGQRVLLLVPDAERGRALSARLQGFLEGLGLHHYVHTALLTGTAVRGWLGGSEVLPQVLVATPQALEEHLYGNRERSAPEVGRLRKLILGLEVLVIDDYLAFDDAVRSHLPFILDKHRFVLAAEHVPLQALVSCPGLADLGEQVLGKRLFTLQGFRHENLLTLKPRRAEEAWLLTITVADPTAAATSLAAQRLAEGNDVVLFLRGVEKPEAARLEAQLTGGSVTVLGELEAPLAPGLQLPAAFFPFVVPHDTCLLVHDADSLAPVLIAIQLAGSLRATESTRGVVPAIPPRGALAFVAPHLRSVARFLPERTPTPIEAWVQMGIEPARLPAHHAGSSGAEAAILCDRWLESAEDVPLATYMTVTRCKDQPQPVAVHRLPDDSWRVTASPSSGDVFLGRAGPEGSASAGSSSRIARWVSDGGQEFGVAGQVDLAHATELRLHHDGRTFAPRLIDISRAGGIQITADLWRGGGIDRYLMVRRFAWELSGGLTVDSMWGGESDGVRWLELSAVGGAPVTVNAAILGQMSQGGDTTDLRELRYSYAAQLSVLALEPGALDRRALDETVDTSLAGKWSTSSRDGARFWPELTAALTVALNERAPGLLYLARPLAFAPAAADPVGRALVFLVEPTTSVGTARHTVARLLAHPEERRSLMVRAAEFLAELEVAEGSTQQCLRRHAQAGHEGDDELLDPELARALLSGGIG